MTIDRLADQELTAQAHHTGGDDCVVVVISTSNRRRIAVADLVGSLAPVVLVSSRAEAARMFEVAALEEPPPPESIAEPLIEVDSDGRVVRVENQSVGLSPLEHDLLTVLLETPGRICEYADLHERVWGHSYELARDDVASVVKRLREKLRRLRSPVRIEAVRGVGLRLIRER